MKKLFNIAAIMVLAAGIVSCGGNNKKNDKASTTPAETPSTETEVKEVNVDEDKPESKDIVLNLSGKVSTAPVHATVVIDEFGNVRGRYYYDKQKAAGNNASLKIYGDVTDGEFTAVEFEKEDVTGVFMGTLKDDKLEGTFTRFNDGKEMPYSLKVDKEAANNFELSELTFDAPAMTLGEALEQSGAGKWNALLDEYEESMTKCIDLSKKIAAGNNAVYGEYLDAMNGLNELAAKITDIQDELSSDQAARFINIQNKIASQLTR